MKGFFTICNFIPFVIFLATSTIFSQQVPSTEIQAGYQLLKSQDFQTAHTFFSDFLQSNPNNNEARVGLAIALIGIDKFPEASRQIAQLLSRSPNNPMYLEMAAKTFWVQKRFLETEKVLKRRIDLGNSSIDVWALYGDTLDAQKKTEQAISAYKEVVRLSPDSINYRYALGSLYWKSIRYDEAIREFMEILKHRPNEPRASFNLGDIYLSKGDAEKAVSYLENAAKSFPNEFDTRFALGRAYIAVKKYQQAVTELEIAVKLRSEIPEGYYYLAVALQKLGKRDEAKTAFDKTRELQNRKRLSESVIEKN